MDLVLFGIQGSGKGTQAKKLAAEFGYEIFEAGGELRKIAASGTELGATVKSYIDAGKLVPHEIIMQVVKTAILARPSSQKILFDGIPRDKDQQRDFDAIMTEAKRDFIGIEITLDRDEAKKRIFGRAKVEGRRDDADAGIIDRRMQTFTRKTLPVIQDYVKRGKVKKLDGKKSVDEVYAEMVGLLK